MRNSTACVMTLIAAAFVLPGLLGCATGPSGPRIDSIPMYGQPEIPRPDVLKLADETFVAAAAAGIGTREKASQAWYAQGEDYFRDGNLDFAMRRYNQSWLLNPSNYKPYWGFGSVMLRQGKCDEALRHFAKATELADDRYQKVALLSDFGVAYAYCAKIMPTDKREARAKYFEMANRLFAESTGLDPTYANAWLRWSQSLLQEDRPAEAWTKLKRARETGAQIPPPYLERLTLRMPEPK